MLTEETMLKSVKEIKNLICEDALLAFTDFSKKSILTTDASAIRVGALLSQLQDRRESY